MRNISTSFFASKFFIILLDFSAAQLYSNFHVVREKFQQTFPLLLRYIVVAQMLNYVYIYIYIKLFLYFIFMKLFLL